MSQKPCGDSTDPLGNVFQCFRIIMLKGPIGESPMLQLVSIDSKPVTMYLQEELASSSLCPPTRYVRSSLSFLLLKLERPHSFSQPLLAHHEFHSPHLTSLMTFTGPTPCTSVILVLGSPKEDTVLERAHLEEVSFE